jgi:hypothetical protein
MLNAIQKVVFSIYPHFPILFHFHTVGNFISSANYPTYPQGNPESSLSKPNFYQFGNDGIF